MQDFDRRLAQRDALAGDGQGDRSARALHGGLPRRVFGVARQGSRLQREADVVARGDFGEPAGVIGVGVGQHQHVDAPVPEGERGAEGVEGAGGAGAAVHQQGMPGRGAHENRVALADVGERHFEHLVGPPQGGGPH